MPNRSKRASSHKNSTNSKYPTGVSHVESSYVVGCPRVPIQLILRLIAKLCQIAKSQHAGTDKFSKLASLGGDVLRRYPESE